MVLTSSTMLPLGTKAPDFTLPEPATGTQRTLAQVSGTNGVLVIFMCNHCPYVKMILPFLPTLADKLSRSSVSVVAISSNDVASHPEDAPDQMALLANQSLNFPYLFDHTQQVAKDYRAACTPDFYLFDANAALVYRGRLDDARPGGAKPNTGRDVLAAADRMLAGEAPSASTMRPSMGCNIKWRPNNAPDYFA